MDSAMLFWTVLVVLVVGLLTSFRKIPKVHYASVERIGKLTGTFLPDGPRFVLPFWIDQTELIPMTLRTKEFKVEVTSKNKVKLTIDGVYQYKPANINAESRLVPGKKLLVTWMEVPDPEVERGIVATVKSDLGNISTTLTADEFNDMREALGLMINSILRLEEIPHLTASKIDPSRTSDLVIPTDRPKFYQDNQKKIADLLEGESTRGSNAQIEHLYGIEIIKVEIEKIAWDPKYAEAQQQEQEALKNNAAVTQRVQNRAAMIGLLKASGLDVKEANIAIDVLEGKGQRNVNNLDVSGINGLGAAIVGALTSRKGP